MTNDKLGRLAEVLFAIFIVWMFMNLLVILFDGGGAGTHG